jgi:hypothetical protein
LTPLDPATEACESDSASVSTRWTPDSFNVPVRGRNAYFGITELDGSLIVRLSTPLPFKRDVVEVEDRKGLGQGAI